MHRKLPLRRSHLRALPRKPRPPQCIPARNAVRRNAGHAGCGSLKASTCKQHEAKYHQKIEHARVIHKSLDEQASEDDRMVRVLMLVYWLASEGLLLLKIYALAMLIRRLDFRDTVNCV